MSTRKKRYIISYVLLVAAYILQTTLVREIAIFKVSPSLILVSVVCFSLVNEPVGAAVYGGIAGILMDISSGRTLGFNAVLMMYLALLVVFAGQEFFRDTLRSATFVVVLSTVVYEVVYAFFNFAIFGDSSFWYMIFRVVLVEALYNAVFAPFVYMLYRRFLKIRTGHSLFD
ncbi:MAG: rod shape-determining protein MreD [Ruminococcaceae bacterium]|nr:rod shape-determining protein MreD [Oscillospiraceae bacterium]